MIGTLIAKHVAQKQFAARALNDVDPFLAQFSEDAVFLFPSEPSVGGTFHGLTEIRVWFERYRELFPQPHFELFNVFVSRLFALGNTNELAIQRRVRLTDQNGAEVCNQGVTIVQVQHGKTVLVHEFLFDRTLQKTPLEMEREFL